MRVISGIYKRRRFDVPRTFKARPTTDFAKENLFNVLNNYIDFEERVTALDLFAGTGSISIELVSRGCDRVISVETALEMKEIFLQDQRESTQIFLKNWVKRSWRRRAAESVVRLLAPLL